MQRSIVERFYHIVCLWNGAGVAGYALKTAVDKNKHQFDEKQETL